MTSLLESTTTGAAKSRSHRCVVEGAGPNAESPLMLFPPSSAPAPQHLTSTSALDASAPVFDGPQQSARALFTDTDEDHLHHHQHPPPQEVGVGHGGMMTGDDEARRVPAASSLSASKPKSKGIAIAMASSHDAFETLTAVSNEPPLVIHPMSQRARHPGSTGLALRDPSLPIDAAGATATSVEVSLQHRQQRTAAATIGAERGTNADVINGVGAAAAFAPSGPTTPAVDKVRQWQQAMHQAATPDADRQHISTIDAAPRAAAAEKHSADGIHRDYMRQPRHTNQVGQRPPWVASVSPAREGTRPSGLLGNTPFPGSVSPQRRGGPFASPTHRTGHQELSPGTVGGDGESPTALERLARPSHQQRSPDVHRDQPALPMHHGHAAPPALQPLNDHNAAAHVRFGQVVQGGHNGDHKGGRDYDRRAITFAQHQPSNARSDSQFTSVTDRVPAVLLGSPISTAVGPRGFGAIDSLPQPREHAAHASVNPYRSPSRLRTSPPSNHDSRSPQGIDGDQTHRSGPRHESPHAHAHAAVLAAPSWSVPLPTGDEHTGTLGHVTLHHHQNQNTVRFGGVVVAQHQGGTQQQDEVLRGGRHEDESLPSSNPTATPPGGAHGVLSGADSRGEEAAITKSIRVDVVGRGLTEEQVRSMMADRQRAAEAEEVAAARRRAMLMELDGPSRTLQQGATVERSLHHHIPTGAAGGSPPPFAVKLGLQTPPRVHDGLDAANHAAGDDLALGARTTKRAENVASDPVKWQSDIRTRWAALSAHCGRLAPDAASTLHHSVVKDVRHETLRPRFGTDDLHAAANVAADAVSLPSSATSVASADDSAAFVAATSNDLRNLQSKAAAVSRHATRLSPGRDRFEMNRRLRERERDTSRDAVGRPPGEGSVPPKIVKQLRSPVRLQTYGTGNSPHTLLPKQGESALMDVDALPTSKLDVQATTTSRVAAGMRRPVTPTRADARRRRSDSDASLGPDAVPRLDTPRLRPTTAGLSRPDPAPAGNNQASRGERRGSPPLQPQSPVEDLGGELSAPTHATDATHEVNVRRVTSAPDVTRTSTLSDPLFSMVNPYSVGQPALPEASAAAAGRLEETAQTVHLSSGVRVESLVPSDPLPTIVGQRLLTPPMAHLKPPLRSVSRGDDASAQSENDIQSQTSRVSHVSSDVYLARGAEIRALLNAAPVSVLQRQPTTNQPASSAAQPSVLLSKTTASNVAPFAPASIEPPSRSYETAPKEDQPRPLHPTAPASSAFLLSVGGENDNETEGQRRSFDGVAPLSGDVERLLVPTARPPRSPMRDAALLSVPSPTRDRKEDKAHTARGTVVASRGEASERLSSWALDGAARAARGPTPTSASMSVGDGSFGTCLSDSTL